MVNGLKLNEKFVREAVPEPGRDYQIFNSEVRGFACQSASKRAKDLILAPRSQRPGRRDDHPNRFFRTAGQVSDITGAAALPGHLPVADWLLSDRGYDADWFREDLQKGIKPCIPGRNSRGKPVEYDKRRSKRSNRTEIMFGRLKDWRRVATRYNSSQSLSLRHRRNLLVLPMNQDRDVTLRRAALERSREILAGVQRGSLLPSLAEIKEIPIPNGSSIKSRPPSEQGS
jgi:transposase